MAKVDTSKIKVLYSRELAAQSGDGSPRYIIIDAETGEIIDDAQGYGFKSPQKAYACYYHRQTYGDWEKRKESIMAWMKEHKELENMVVAEQIECLQDGEQFTARNVERLFKEFELKPDFTAKEFLRAWRGK